MLLPNEQYTSQISSRPSVPLLPLPTIPTTRSKTSSRQSDTINLIMSIRIAIITLNGRLLRQALLETDGQEITQDHHHRPGQLGQDHHPQYSSLHPDKLHLNEVKQTVPSTPSLTQPSDSIWRWFSIRTCSSRCGTSGDRTPYGTSNNMQAILGDVLSQYKCHTLCRR